MRQSGSSLLWQYLEGWCARLSSMNMQPHQKHTNKIKLYNGFWFNVPSESEFATFWKCGYFTQGVKSAETCHHPIYLWGAGQVTCQQTDTLSWCCRPKREHTWENAEDCWIFGWDRLVAKPYSNRSFSHNVQNDNATTCDNLVKKTCLKHAVTKVRVNHWISRDKLRTAPW